MAYESKNGYTDPPGSRAQFHLYPVSGILTPADQSKTNIQF